MSDWALDAPEGELFAYVWACDDDCMCEQAQIVLIERNSFGGWKKATIVWEGEYHVWEMREPTDPEPTTELNREARRLRKHHNALFHRISWPWDRK